jgi:hypothetical protein
MSPEKAVEELFVRLIRRPRDYRRTFLLALARNRSVIAPRFQPLGHSKQRAVSPRDYLLEALLHLHSQDPPFLPFAL